MMGMLSQLAAGKKPGMDPSQLGAPAAQPQVPDLPLGPNPPQAQNPMSGKMDAIMKQMLMANLVPQDNGSRTVNSLLPLLQLLAKGGKPADAGISGLMGDFDGAGVGSTMIA